MEGLSHEALREGGLKQGRAQDVFAGGVPNSRWEPEAEVMAGFAEGVNTCRKQDGRPGSTKGAEGKVSGVKTQMFVYQGET